MAHVAGRSLRMEHSETNAAVLIVAALSVASLGLLLNAGAFAALVILVGASALVLATVQPLTGLYLVTFAAVAIDANTPFVRGSWLNVPLTDYGVGATPLELLMAFSLLGTGIRLVFDDEVQLRAGALLLPISVLMLTILAGIAVGMTRGADMRALRAETRAMFYLPTLSLIATHCIRTRRDVRRFVTIFMIAVNLVAAVSIYHYYHDVRDTLATGPSDLAFPHENAMFCAAGIMLMLSRTLWSRNVFAEWRSVLLIALPMVALLVMRRRAGIVALDGALVLMCIILVRDNFRLFLIVVPIAVLGVGLLLAITWNNSGGMGEAARSFRTIAGTQDQLSARDQSSDNYRATEDANVRVNIENEGVVGLGFGRPYVFYIPLPNLSGFWPLWAYTPHNTILWIWMKGGVLAFVALLTVFGAAILRSMQMMRGLRADTLKPVAFALGAMVLMFAMFSYVDLGLVTPRAMMFFGMVLGAIGALGIVTQPRYLRPAASGRAREE